MRTLLGSVRTNPEKKMKDIGHMVNRLFQAGAENLEQWGIKIDAEPIDMKSRKLAVPQLIHNSGNDELFCSERLLKQMPVYNSRSLEKMTIVFMYDGNQHPNDIDKMYNELRKCQDQLGMNAKSIVKHALKFYPRHAHKEGQKMDQVIREAVDDICDEHNINDRTQDLAVLFLVNYENDYHNIKKSFNKLAILTQCMARKNAKRFNLSVASNVMK